jgi:phosphate transport system substrate-binding protein
MNLKFLHLATLTLWLISGCNNQDLENHPGNYFSKQKENLKKGKGTVLLDESYMPLFNTLLYTFQSTRPEADISLQYLPELKNVQLFLEDNELKVLTIAGSKELSKKEYESITTTNKRIDTKIIGYDALILIANPSNRVEYIRQSQIRQWLTTNDVNWPNSKNPISIVIDHQFSTNYHTIKTKITDKAFGNRVFQQAGTDSVIAYVNRNPNSIGIIGYNWLSDRKDPATIKRLKQVKILSVFNEQTGSPIFPSQESIRNHLYPYIRPIRIINRGIRNGINTGFVNFILSEVGQLILDKSGLVPEIDPFRQVELKTE